MAEPCSKDFGEYPAHSDEHRASISCFSGSLSKKMPWSWVDNMWYESHVRCIMTSQAIMIIIYSSHEFPSSGRDSQLTVKVRVFKSELLINLYLWLWNSSTLIITSVIIASMVFGFLFDLCTLFASQGTFVGSCFDAEGQLQPLTRKITISCGSRPWLDHLVWSIHVDRWSYHDTKHLQWVILV